jgi:putative transposase
MMGRTRKSYDNEYKARVVLESLQKTVTQERILAKYGISASMLNRWRKQFLANAHVAFEQATSQKKTSEKDSPEYLKKIIGDITVENEILKKALSVWD